jgi:hypothetical protein
MTAASAETLVANLMEELGALTATLQTGSDQDRRDVVRALTDQILVNPDTGDVEVTFFAIPRLPSPNEQRTDRPFESDLSSVSQMAGARLVGPKRTCWVRIVRKPWLLDHRRRRLAV